ncbi:MAG TPA: hypothetical protein VKC58_15340 [Myxococcales bacterium]|jgi:hypothetical protein|nr:hypothetical protein [Myxococcales bacterium]
MKARWLAAVEKRPWALAVIAGSGTTLLVPSALALLAPPELLDAAVALGDRRLALALVALFAMSICSFRLSFRRRRSAEEQVDAGVRGSAAIEMSGAGARPAGAEVLAAGEVRSYLR